MLRKSIYFRFYFLACFVTLAACSSPPASMPQGTRTEPYSERSITPSEDIGSPSSPATSGIPEVVQKTTSIYFTPTPSSPPATLTPPSGLVYQVCTPLTGHTLKDLQEIITNPFDPPPQGKDTGHHGVDFAYYRRGDRLSILGVTIQAVLGGDVATVVNDRPPYGNMVIIETPYNELPAGITSLLDIPTGSSVYLLYAHMNHTPALPLGQSVTCGQALGEVGNTPKGWSSDPHLHLEGRTGLREMRLLSMAFYTTSATVEEMDNYKLWRMSGSYKLFDPMKLLVYGLGTK